MTELPPKPDVNFAGIGILILVLVALSLLLDIEELKRWVESVGPWVPLAFIVLKVLTIVVVPLTGAPVYPLVGLLFGLWPGLAYVAIGDFIGFSLAFWMSRLFGQKVVESLIAQREGTILAHIVEKVEQPKGFFQVTLSLLPMPELLSYGAGLTKLRYPVFIFILWPMWTIVATILVLIGSFFDLGENPLLLTLVIPLIAVAMFILGGVSFARGIRAKRKADSTSQ